jgi:hypothetical protein
MKRGAYSRRQANASKRHDAASEIAAQIAEGAVEIKVIDDNNWKIAATTGTSEYLITRQGCHRHICAVQYSQQNNERRF